MKKRPSEEQIIRMILREAESQERPIKDVCRQRAKTLAIARY